MNSLTTTLGTIAGTLPRMLILALVYWLNLFQFIIAQASVQTPFSSPSLDIQLDSTLHGSESCKQVSPLFPRQAQLDKALESLFTTKAFRKQSADALGAIVRIP